MERKKILYIITKGHHGGVVRYVFDLISALPNTVFSTSVAFGVPGLLKKKLEQKGVPVIEIPYLARDVSIKNDILSFFEIYKIIRREKPDVVHLNSSKVGGIGALAARLAGTKKIIFTVHGFAFKEDRPKIENLAIKFLSFVTVLLATHNIFIAKREKEIAETWPFCAKKCFLIPNGVQAIEFLDKTTAQQELARIINKDPSIFSGKKVILTIALLDKNKDLETGILAVKDIPDVIYIIIGEGERRPHLEKLLKDNALGHKVFLPGFVEDAYLLMKGADIFLLSSLKEGLPYVILEAGLAELRVLATTVGGIPDIIENRTSGILVTARNPREMEAGLLAMLRHPDETEVYGKNLRKKIETVFSLEKMVSSTATLYTE